ncbi:hypothetical protein HWV07_06810 [Natronomonas salina]|uniref:hypothetical protein n=1 Tax=Natronomonas salina TaxID=1710540 RepID=UPI0015B383D3|nr:hypothetical protein [Natronomonas salina]QLD88760.1 hypothetical protein HWV07_06810 [Natronomonas salina]
MERRDVLKTVGTIGTATVAGGIGALAFFGGSAAAKSTLEVHEPEAVTTDDGTIERVSFGGRFKFEWDGLDQDANYGWYQTETRVRQQGESEFSSWRSHGTDYGQLGASWGGGNDYTQDTGTDGYWQFKFGAYHDNEDYVLAGSVPDNMRPVENPYDTSVFNTDEDGAEKDTVVEFRYTGRVYNGEPGNGGTRLQEDVATGEMIITVGNRAATATTSGSVRGNVDADES